MSVSTRPLFASWGGDALVVEYLGDLGPFEAFGLNPSLSIKTTLAKSSGLNLKLSAISWIFSLTAATSYVGIYPLTAARSNVFSKRKWFSLLGCIGSCAYKEANSNWFF